MARSHELFPTGLGLSTTHITDESAKSACSRRKTDLTSTLLARSSNHVLCTDCSTSHAAASGPSVIAATWVEVPSGKLGTERTARDWMSRLSATSTLRWLCGPQTSGTIGQSQPSSPGTETSVSGLSPETRTQSPSCRPKPAEQVLESIDRYCQRIRPAPTRRRHLPGRYCTIPHLLDIQQ